MRLLAALVAQQMSGGLGDVSRYPLYCCTTSAHFALRDVRGFTTLRSGILDTHPVSANYNIFRHPSFMVNKRCHFRGVKRIVEFL